MKSNNKRIWDAKDLMQYFNISSPTLYRWVKAGSIPKPDPETHCWPRKQIDGHFEHLIKIDRNDSDLISGDEICLCLDIPQSTLLLKTSNGSFPKRKAPGLWSRSEIEKAGYKLVIPKIPKSGSLSIAQVAHVLGISVSYAFMLSKEGKIPGHEGGDSWDAKKIHSFKKEFLKRNS